MNENGDRMLIDDAYTLSIELNRKETDGHRYEMNDVVAEYDDRYELLSETAMVRVYEGDRQVGWYSVS